MGKPQDWLRLDGKVALVTGAGRGIGRGIAATLAAAGASVVVADVDAASARDVAASIGGRGIQLDVANEAAVDAAVADVVQCAGGLDIAVNNAGIYLGYGGPVVDLKTDAWRKLMSVNLDGVFYCCRAAARVMIRGGRSGRIINIASTQAVTPGVGVSYDGSKAAVAQMTRVLALELAPHGINVNALAPGATWVVEGEPAPVINPDPPPPITGEPLADTVADRIRRIPLRRWGTPEDIGKAALFLASPLSDYITGVYLPVDGGWLVL